MENKEITIYDIAKALSISPSTVSRGLSNHPAINGKTKNKILKVARDMGYQSNKFASSLRKKKTDTRAGLIPEVDSSRRSSGTGGIRKAVKTGADCLRRSRTREREKTGRTTAGMMFQSGVDGVLVSRCRETRDRRQL